MIKEVILLEKNLNLVITYNSRHKLYFFSLAEQECKSPNNKQRIKSLCIFILCLLLVNFVTFYVFIQTNQATFYFA